MTDTTSTDRNKIGMHAGLIVAATMLAYLAAFGFPMLTQNASLKEEMLETERLLENTQREMAAGRNKLASIETQFAELAVDGSHQFTALDSAAPIASADRLASPTAAIVTALEAAGIAPKKIAEQLPPEDGPRTDKTYHAEFQASFTQVHYLVRQLELNFVCRSLSGESESPDSSSNGEPGQWSIVLSERHRRDIQ